MRTSEASGSAARSLPIVTSTAWTSAAPGSAGRRSSRLSTAPRASASRRSRARGPGASSSRTPSRTAVCARTTSRPCTVDTSATGFSARCAVSVRSRAPSRHRSGTSGSIPTARNGSAVTSPTAHATTPSAKAATSSSCRPRRCATSSSATAPGALVNVTASRARSATRSTSRSTASGSAGGSHRYTDTPRTRAPAATSGASWCSSAAPCSCTTTEQPSTPSATSRSTASAVCSEAADQASRNPLARMTPVALGPRATTGPPHGLQQRSGEAGGVRGLHPAPQADPRRHQDDVRGVGDDVPGVRQQLVVLGQRDDAHGRGVQHARALAFEGGDHVARAAVAGDADRHAQEFRHECGR